jgi:hypothetical protein
MKKSKKNRKQVRRKKTRKSKSATLSVADFSTLSDHLLFSMIGANYLSSDYDNGEWYPVFEDTTTIISIDEQAKKIATQAYISQDENRYLIPCSWVMLPSQNKKKIYDQIVDQFGTDFLSQDFNTEIWELFNNIKNLISPNQ